MRTTVVMMDLENTLVDSWHSGCVLNKKVALIIKKINFLKDFRHVMKYGVFSFAIDNDLEIKRGIELAESAIPIKIDPQWVVPFDKIQSLIHVGCCSELAKWELVNMFGKHDMFLKWAAQFPQVDFVLFDDVLEFQAEEIVRDKQLITLWRV